jgi:TolB-like protein
MLRFTLCIWLALSVVGCGYTTGSLLPSKYRRIAVAPFQNQVNSIDENGLTPYVPLLETKVRTAIIDRFLFDGNLRISDPDKANLILSGDLINIAQDSLRQDINQNVQEYRIRVIVSLTMTDVEAGKVLWKESAFTGESTYFLTGSQASTQSAAIDAALTDLATRVVERTIEDW